MNRILVISSKCYEKARADGLCGKNLKEGFHSNDIFLLGYANIESEGLLNRGNNEYEFFYHEDTKRENRLVKTVKRLCKPEIDYELVKKYEEYIYAIIEKESIDTLIPVFFPLETVVAVSNIKKKHQGINTILYEVDSSTDVEYYLGRLDKNYIASQKRYMCKMYQYYDYVLVMNSHYEHAKKLYGKILKDKLWRIDSPVLCFSEKMEYDFRKDRDTVNFYYTGFLNIDTYSPEPILRFFELNKEKKNWRLHFYSRGNCEDFLRKVSLNDERIIVHGYVNKEELVRCLKEADIFLSVSYDFKPNSIPSKVFEYFNSNRVVIHFCEKENVFTREYMNRYPRGYVVYNSKLIEDNDKTIGFINKALNGELPVIDAKTVFEMNTPEYSASTIQSILNKTGRL